MNHSFFPFPLKISLNENFLIQALGLEEKCLENFLKDEKKKRKKLESTLFQKIKVFCDTSSAMPFFFLFVKIAEEKKEKKT